MGKSTPVFQVHHSYESALTAINTLTNVSENFALFDDLTFQLILSSVTDDTRNHFLQKTISGLSTQDLDIIKVYFSEDMSLIRTCGKLYLHKNTLQYKLNRIHKITGLNPQKFQDAVLLVSCCASSDESMILPLITGSIVCSIRRWSRSIPPFSLIRE